MWEIQDLTEKNPKIGEVLLLRVEAGRIYERKKAVLEFFIL